MNYIYLVLSGILFGGVVFGGKVLMNMGASLFEVMLFPELIALLLTIYPARKEMKKIFNLPWSAALLMMLSMLLTNLGEFAPMLMKVPVSLIVLILYLQPLWTILIDHFYFHQKQTKLDWILVFVMLAGMLILINPFHDAFFSPLGIFLALLGGIGLSLWVFITKYFSQKGISAYGTFFSVSFYSVIPIFVMYIVSFLLGQNPTLRTLTLDMPPLLWESFIFYSLVVFMLPNILLYKGNKDISAVTIGMILLLEPVTGVILDVIFLNNPLSWNILVGGGIILGSNILLLAEKRRHTHHGLFNRQIESS